jgi:hypothetical protein
LEALHRHLDSKGQSIRTEKNSPRSVKSIAISNLAAAGHNIANTQISPDFFSNRDKNSQNFFAEQKQPQASMRAQQGKSNGVAAVQKEYGLFPKEMIENLLDESADWKVRSNAIEEMNTIIEQNQKNLSDLQPFMSAFLKKVVVKLIMDSNFKICVTMLNILSKLISMPEVKEKGNLTVLVPKLVEKLADSKIAIRQLTNKILKELKTVENVLRYFTSIT